jgi:predicted DNA-binding antitoxin AbrB/MazE fold protein
MAIHLEAVYEQGVLRPLEPLALTEHQRVHLTVEDRKRPLSWESATPTDDGRAELEWLANESRHFAGEWVALDGNRLVAHGPKLAAVKAAALAAGVSQPFFASVPDSDLPFGGW